MTLRDYQKVCVDRVFGSFDSGDSAIAVMPTGTGKTHCFASIIAGWPKDKGKILVIAHRSELLFQAKSKIDLTFKNLGEHGTSGIEMGQLRTTSPYGLLGDTRCVIASVQSMHEDRLKRFNPREFGLVVVDECHHAVKKNKTYWRVLQYFQEGGCKVLGVTATSDRTDEEALGGIFKQVAFSYEIANAIDDGWLVPIYQEMVHVEGLDLSNVSVNHGDLAPGQLNDILSAEQMCHKVVAPTLDIVGDKKTLVFASGCKQASKMCEIFNRHKPGSAINIDGGTPGDMRKDLLTRFGNGEFQFLTSCHVFTEGYDEPTIECVIQARPTKSRMLYAQMAGRGTRVLPGVIEGMGAAPDGYETEESEGVWRISSPEDRRRAISESGKPRLLLIDFVGNAGRHKLVYAGDLLGGEYTDEVIEFATKAIGNIDGPVEVAEELKKAQEVVDEEHRKALEKVRVSAKFKRRAIDPFDVFDISTKREPGWHKGRQPSDKMIAFLRRAKVPLTFDVGRWYIADKNTRKAERVVLTFWKAREVIQEVVRRRDEGLCTYSQARLLRKFGERSDVGFEEASKLIDGIAKRGWKPKFPASA